MSIGVEELGDWRRTHYSIHLNPTLHGQQATVFGWVSSLRRQGGILFLILRDKDGEIQITAKKDEVSPKLFKKIGTLQPHTTIGVKGTLSAIEKAPHGVEIIPDSIKLLGVACSKPPFTLKTKSLPRVDTRLEIRAVDLRNPGVQSIFKIRQVALHAIREHLYREGYLEVNTPKIIASATEGGAALFPILYYDKEAFLTQSPQLYKEELVLAFEKVFEVGPAFRAEQSRTMGHLSEFVSVDIEEAYADYYDEMNRIEALTRDVIHIINRECRQELFNLKVKLPDEYLKPRRYTYDEILSILKDKGVKIEWGEDITTKAFDALSEANPSYYFITDWPSQIKPFYIKPSKNDPKVCESFDYMHGSLEIVSGGSRISKRRQLEARLKEKGLNPRSFEYHLKVYDYGMPPHAGFGLGLERFIMTLTGQSNIREVAFFPRDQFHLKP